MNNPPPQGPSALDRERDRVNELEEQHLRLRQQQEEMVMREREREHNERERQHREQQYQSVPQHQNNTGAIPIHQPVASRLPGAIHSPGGLLANHGGSAPTGPLGAPSGPGNAFGGPLHSEPSRPMQQHNPPSGVSQQHQLFGPGVINHPPGTSAPLGGQGPPATVFGGPLQQDTAARSMQQMPFGGPVVHQAQGNPALAQGQQPILNDALSYLDQVKVQFVDQPDVYNRFLDIMKDFKSQAIDTPGVINRVSELFAGHPNLIQGFNTFLPPGYRIECGAGNDPNTIRVTTPMGTTVQSISGGRALPEGSAIGPNGTFYQGQRGNNWQGQQPQHSIENPEGVFSPQSRNSAPVYGQNQASTASFDAQQAAVHQQEQRGVSQLQNAVATATGHPVPRNALTPTPSAQGPGMNGAAAQQAGIEKRGPVEFNHAISYVNKIKNRFQDKPEIYKQFLEILQTYQRESKPIQDVYAQVTTLFSSAPDLLEDFKQFLPESAAQAKAAAKAAEDAAALGLSGVSQTPQPPARGDQKLPPVGNFPPPSASKEGKKRARPGQAPSAVPMQSLGDGSTGRNSIGQTSNINKRAKISHTGRPTEDAPAISPTLTPQRPQPLSPVALPASQQAEVAFFDKVKKYLSNKQTFAEFLKLCNLYSQDLIDKNVLVHKVSNFIGTNVELMDFFKKFVDYSGPEEVIENKPRAPSGRVSLSNCRGLGPSYRLLPKRIIHNFLARFPASMEASLFKDPLPGEGNVERYLSNDMPSRQLLPPPTSFLRGDCAHMAQYDPSEQSGQNYVFAPHTMCVKRKLFDGGELRYHKRSRKQYPTAAKATIQKWTQLIYDEQERLKPCSGRDEMCYSVLNDDWASHPTWASEDSGFVAHRKNIFEEALHRIEEERHDYDFNIEANSKVIQLLEPLGHQILNLSDAELANFRMPSGFGGQSQSIYKRVLKKVYGPEKGIEIAGDLFTDPVAVIPVVLARLKQKDEEWRFAHREWNKVWNAQTQAMYLKSLDHMGIHVKQADKKIFSPKNIVDLIRMKREEQHRQRSLGANVPRYQFKYGFEDKEVVLDAIRLALVYVNQSSQHNANERERLIEFLEVFVPIFFGIPNAAVDDRVKDISRESPDEDMDDATPELSNGRGRRGNGRTGLLRGVLDRGRSGTKGRSQKEDSAASGSKESTPDISSTIEDDDIEASEALDEASGSEAGPERWLSKNPGPTAMQGTNPLDPTDLELKADQPFKRDWYNLYCNTSIFVFFTLFELLYRRLKALKDSEDEVTEAVQRIRAHKPAKDIGLMDERDDMFTKDFGGSYYSRALILIEQFVEGDVDEAKYQDFMRHYYLKKGWSLYTVSELLKQICRFAASCSTSDGKDKTPEIIRAFESNRASEETTYNIEIDLRKKAEKIVKDSDMFLIRYFPNRSYATTQFIVKDETTFELTDMERKERWKYYVSSFVRIEPTEGVPRDRLKKSVLMKNLPKYDSESDDGAVQQSRKPLSWDEDLVLRICVNTFRLTYKASTSEYFLYRSNDDNASNLKRAAAARSQRFKERFLMNSPWKQDLSHDIVEKIDEEFKTFLDDGEVPTTAYTLPKRISVKRAVQPSTE